MQEYFLTGSETIVTGLTAGSQSNWLPVQQNLRHNIFVKLSGVTGTAVYRIETCPDKDSEPNTDFISNARVDHLDISETADGVKNYVASCRTGYYRINYISGAGSLDAYYFGGR